MALRSEKSTRDSSQNIHRWNTRTHTQICYEHTSFILTLHVLVMHRDTSWCFNHVKYVTFSGRPNQIMFHQSLERIDIHSVRLSHSGLKVVVPKGLKRGYIRQPDTIHGALYTDNPGGGTSYIWPTACAAPKGVFFSQPKMTIRPKSV